MAASVNKVILIGNLTRDPEVRPYGSGEKVVSFSLAMNRRYNSRARNEMVEETTFVECSAFGRTADVISSYCRKGESIFVEGRLRQEQWDDKQTGERRSRLSVVVDAVQLLGSRRNEGGYGAPAQGQYGAPQQGGYAQPMPQYAPPQGQVPQGAPQYAPPMPANNRTAPPMPAFRPADEVMPPQNGGGDVAEDLPF